MYKGYRSLFEYFYTNQSYPQYEKVKKIGEIEFCKEINNRIVLFDNFTDLNKSFELELINNYQMGIKINNKIIQFTPLEIKNFTLKCDKGKKYAKTNMTFYLQEFGRTGIVTNLEICLMNQITPNSEIFILR